MRMDATRVLVTGAGGFIGQHLVKRLKRQGAFVRGVDLKLPEYEESAADEFEVDDLRGGDACLRATRDVEQVFHLAADLGGMGTQAAASARSNVLIDVHMLEASRANGIRRYLFASSASVDPRHLQTSSDAAPREEGDAIPADLEPGRGWEKLYGEQLCRCYRRDYGFEARSVRFQNVYGPLCAFEGGREQAPAAIARKVACAGDGDELEIGGDGQQTRAFLHVDDCVEGLLRIMASEHAEPLNLGTRRRVSVDQLADMLCAIAGKRLDKVYDRAQPQGARGRTSDNSLLRQVLGWEPAIPLEEGLVATYRWIEERVRQRAREAREAA